jgi:hypothetical protein
VTSSNCRLAAQYDDGAFFTKRPFSFEKISSVSLGFFAQIALIQKSSVGRSLQVKGLRICFVLLPAFDGPRASLLMRRKETMRDGSPPSKASSTLCRRSGFAKSLESFQCFENDFSFSNSQGVRFDRRLSFLDLPAKGNPLLKVRVLGSCRKSVADKNFSFEKFKRPTGPLFLVAQRRRLLVSQREHCPKSAAPF